MMHKTITLTALLICWPSLQMLRADDFNRPDVAYTHTASKLGWYWKASGASAWSLKDHEILVDNSDASVQENDQILYNTRVPLVSGSWSASVDVRDQSATRRVGLAFMIGAGGTDHYQIRLQFGSRQVQVLQRGSAGSQTIYSDNASSSEDFDVSKFYTVNVWSSVATQFNWNINNDAGKIVASSSFTDANYTSGYAGLIKGVGDGNADIARFDNFYVREITVPPITRPHPRLLVTPADIVNIKAAISSHTEPRYSAWLDLKSRADGWSDDAVAPPYTGRDSGVFYSAARTAGHLASKMALAYLLNGTPAHASKAKAILLTWAQATPFPGSNFDPAIRFPSSGMETARAIVGFIYAYDYLYDQLTPAERTLVENWFRAMLPTIKKGIDRWNTPFQLSSTDSRGYTESGNLDNICFYGQLYQNHLVSHSMGYLMMGYAMGDQALVQFAVDSKENPRDFCELFEGMIMMAGDSMFNSGDTANPRPQDGEIIDRYRHLDNGLAGLGYASLSLHQMMAMTETMFANGLDFYTRVGAYGETMQKPFSFYADIYRLGDSSANGGFYTGESVADYPIAVFEVANKRYPGNAEIEALLKSVVRYNVDDSGYVETYFCYPTLTHGVVRSWTGTATTNFETAANWEAAKPADSSSADIAHFDVIPPHMPQLTTSRSVAGLAFGASGITLSGAATQMLTLGASGITNGISGAGTNTVAVALKLAADQSWDVASGKTLLVREALSGTPKLTKTGTGTLIISGANSSTGTTTISGGTLQIGNDGATGTLGSGNVVNNGILRFDRTGTVLVPNVISGSGSITINCPTIADGIELSGANSFSGNVTIGSGSLRVHAANNLGTGTKSVTAKGTAAQLRLNGSAGDIALSGSISYVTSNPNGAIVNEAGTNTLNGNITMSSGAGDTKITAAAGTLTLNGNLTANVIDRSLILGGAGTGLFNGDVINTGEFPYDVTKNDSGTWTLAGSNNYSGATTINAGILALSGSMTSNVTATNGTLAPSGTASTTGNVAINIGGRFAVRIDGPTVGTQYDQLSIGGTVTLAGALDLVATPGLAPGMNFTLLNKTSTGAIMGTFTDLPQGAEFYEDSQWWRISYTGGTGNDLVLTLITPTPWQSWLGTNFGTNANNAAISGDFADCDNDGLVTRLEYALGGNPNLASSAEFPRPIVAGGKLALTFTRTVANTDITMTVQASDSLNATWNDLARSTSGGVFTALVSGVTISETGTGATRSVEVSDISLLSTPAHPQRFLRISVTRP